MYLPSTNPRTTRLLALLSLLCGSLASLDAAEDKELKAKDVLNNIRVLYEKRSDQMNPIWVRYKITRRLSVAWQQATHMTNIAGEARFEDEGEYARKGSRLWSWRKTNDPRIQPWSRDTFVVYNGEISISKSSQENTYLISTKWDESLVSAPPTSIMREKAVLGALTRWHKGDDKLFHLSVLEKPGGDEPSVMVVGWTHEKSGWRINCWFLPEKGWVLQRYESYDKSNHPVDKTVVTAYKDIGGICFPTAGERRHYMGGGALGETIAFQVESIETQAGKISDNLFAFKIPEDALIWDVDNKAIIRKTDLAQSHLNELVRRAEPRGIEWWRWTLLGLLVAELVVLGLLVLKWPKKRVSMGSRNEGSSSLPTAG
jgi:hypothetical protein